ncbi:MAG: pyridoxamine 5'-phosphate oxidase [Bacteroidota bacterium]
MTLGKSVADIRKDYLMDSLEEKDVQKIPFQQFEQWFDAAVKSEVLEPNAMALATVKDGRPSLRIVLLKGFDEKGMVFYTNYESKKAQELAENPLAALTFFWPELERQVRIEGSIEKVGHEESDTYYQSRGRGSRIGAWASPQSQVIENRSILEQKVQDIQHKFEGKERFPKPDHWGGYRLKPDYFEFWQGRSSRLHDRIIYSLQTDGNWDIKRLAP